MWRSPRPPNTGVPGATTQQGTFPIYARFTSTTMSGTNPDGSKYSDPGVPWVNYFNGGDAVHGFPAPPTAPRNPTAASSCRSAPPSASSRSSRSAIS